MIVNDFTDYKKENNEKKPVTVTKKPDPIHLIPSPILKPTNSENNPETSYSAPNTDEVDDLDTSGITFTGIGSSGAELTQSQSDPEISIAIPEAPTGLAANSENVEETPDFSAPVVQSAPVVNSIPDQDTELYAFDGVPTEFVNEDEIEVSPVKVSDNQQTYILVEPVITQKETTTTAATTTTIFTTTTE